MQRERREVSDVWHEGGWCRTLRGSVLHWVYKGGALCGFQGKGYWQSYHGSHRGFRECGPCQKKLEPHKPKILQKTRGAG